MIRRFKEFFPEIGEGSYIFDTATIIGNVKLGKDCIVYPGVVIRGECEKVLVGDKTNFQENACIHTEEGMDVQIGSGVTIGHNAIVHACTIADNCLIGMGAIVQDGVVLEENCYVGAGAIVPRNMVIPSGHIVYGVPAKIIRPITPAEYEEIRLSTEEYQENLQEFLRQEKE